MLIRIAILATFATVAWGQTTTSSGEIAASSTAEASVAETTTDAPISVVPIRDVPSERPVFKMNDNRINLKAEGFNVTTPGATFTLVDGQAELDATDITLDAASIKLQAPTVMVGGDTTNIMTNMQTGVAIKASDEIKITSTGATTIKADRAASLTSQDMLDITTTGATSITAKSVAISGSDSVTLQGDSVLVTSGSSKVGIEAAAAVLNSDTITIKAKTAMGVTAATVTVGANGKTVVLNSDGVAVTSNGKITFKTAKRTITLEDIMTKLDTLNNKVGSLETDLSGTEKSVSDSISTNEATMAQLATDEDTLSSAISTQASTLDASAVSLADYMDDTERALEEDVDSTMASLDTVMVNLDAALDAAGTDRGVLSGIVSTARDTFDGQVADLKSVLMADITKASPDALSTSVSTGLSTLAQAVKTAEAAFAARLTQSSRDVAGIGTKVVAAHNTLAAAKTGLQVADLSLSQRVDKAEEAVTDLNAEVANANTKANAANVMIPLVSTAARNVPRPPNAAMVAGLSTPVKQMTSDVRVLKNWVTGAVGEVRPAATFTALVRDSSDYYGGTCSFYKGVAACGNWYQNPGSVDLFVIDAANTKVTRSANLRPPTAAVPYLYGRFGSDVALDDTWLVIGAYQDYASRTNRAISGRVYVYRLGASKGSVITSTWHELTNSVPGNSDYCGNTVSVSNNFVFFSCPYDDIRFTNQGSIIVQQYDAGTKKFALKATLTHSGASSYHYFGRTNLYSLVPQGVTAHNDIVVAGASYSDRPSTNAGGAFVFVRDGNSWVERQALYSARTNTYQYCGDAVFFRGDYLIVSCPRATIGTTTYTGSVEVYRYNSAKRATAPFEYVQTLTTPTLATYTYFGATIGMNDEGTRIAASTNTGAGALFFFNLVNDKFVYESTMTGTNTAAPFGYSALYPHEDYLIAGSVFDDTVASNAGALDLMVPTFPKVTSL